MDLFFIIITAIFFVAAFFYVFACDSLKESKND